MEDNRPRTPDPGPGPGSDAHPGPSSEANDEWATQGSEYIEEEEVPVDEEREEWENEARSVSAKVWW